MHTTLRPVPFSIATFVAEGGHPVDLPPGPRGVLFDLLREIGNVTAGLEHEDYDDALPLLEAIANPDPAARCWADQWEIELTCVPLLRDTIHDLLSLELL
jgi:hypothetical protein